MSGPTHDCIAGTLPSPFRLSLGCLLALLAIRPTLGAEPIVTNDEVFSIPFSVDGKNQFEDLQEVQLFVSGDRGESWQLYQRQKPDVERFTFRAGVDGEFWFAVRSVFADGHADIDQITTPALKVIVDRQAPALSLEVDRTGDGQVRATWNATDPLLDARSLRLEYQIDADEAWQSVRVADQSPSADDTRTTQGQACWAIGDQARLVHLRAEIRDRAGNQQRVVRKLSPQPSASGALFPPPASESPPVDLPQPLDEESALTGESPWPAQHAERPPVTHHESMEGWRAPGNPLCPSQIATSGVRPPAGTGAGCEPAAVSPTGEPRVSNSSQFELDYTIDSTAASIHRVEVWFSQDGGRTWRHHGDDLDKRSPYLAKVSGEGVYGFRLLVQTKEAFLTPPPASGDPPDIWVEVDATLPEARITAAESENGGRRQLVVAWEAADRNLAVKPITLLYGDSPHGPWRIAANDLANTGRVVWEADERTPQLVYLRLEARDRAGNVGIHVLQEPIRLTTSAPQAHIRCVRPIP